MAEVRAVVGFALLVFISFSSGCGRQVREEPPASTPLEDVRVTLVHLVGARIGGPDDERLEVLADAVGAISALPRTHAVLFGPGVFEWPEGISSERVASTLERLGSVLSILVPPVRPVLARADLGDQTLEEQVLRFFEHRKAVPIRAASYTCELAPGARLIVLGESGREGALATFLRTAFAETSAPVLIVAAASEPDAAEIRALIAKEPRVRCIVCGTERPEGRPARYPVVLTSPELADQERFRVIEIGAGVLISWTRGLFEGAPADRIRVPLAPVAATVDGEPGR